MKKRNLFALLLLPLASLPLCSYTALASEQVIQQQLSTYQTAGAADFDADRGSSLWHGSHMQPKLGKAVSCSSCHSTHLQHSGQHLRTGKLIEAMAPSVNSERFGDPKKIEKWFRRNCKWTWGRECTAQEKGDILTFLKAQ